MQASSHQTSRCSASPLVSGACAEVHVLKAREVTHVRSLLLCVCYIFMHVPRVATHLQVRPAGEVRFTSLRAVMRQLQQEVKGPSAELQPQRSGRVGPS